MTEESRSEARLIELEDVHLAYRSGFFRRRLPVLRGISFSVTKGSIVGYLGVNGAGKTTTIKLLAGINRPDAGRLRVLGGSPESPETRNRVGFLPENPYFYEYLTPREALDFYARLHGLSQERRERQITELLARVQLTAHADAPVRGFSKGMRQRLGLAQALVHDPELLILDEPLTGLDPMGRLLLREIILGEARAGRTVFFSSHVLSDVEAICDHLVIINGGEIAFVGARDELLRSSERGRALVRWREPEGATRPESLEAIPWLRGPESRPGGVEAEVAKESGGAVLDALRESGMELLEFRVLGGTLEEVFLERFGKELPGVTARRSTSAEAGEEAAA